MGKVTNKVWEVQVKSTRLWEMDVLAPDEESARTRAMAFADAMIIDVDAILSSSDEAIYAHLLGDVTYPDKPIPEWGFDFETIPEVKFDELPSGHYTLELTNASFKLNSKGERYLWLEYLVGDALDADLIGKKHYQYVSLDPKRLQRTKADFCKMGVPDRALSGDGGPCDMEGTVFECDLVKNSAGAIVMQKIKSGNS